MRRGTVIGGILLLLAGAHADRLTLHDGAVIENCYIRDEGVRLIVWERLEDVGTDRWKVYPRRLVKEFTIERDAAWDAKPNLPDLTVTHIELNPKLAGLHGRVEYDVYGRPKIVGGRLPDLGERAYMEPEAVVQGLKFQYTPGETITMTAHVKNAGFADAAPFEYVWLIDDKEIARGRVTKRLKPQERIELKTRWQWQDGFHHVSFRIRTNQREIATINNQITDPLWGFAFFYIVHKERVKVWNEFRNAYGTFAWEDYYRWHLDIMNLLFEQSVYPSAPEGIKARVRLDRIIYADDMDEAIRNRFSADGIAYDQGGWIFISDEDRDRNWKAPEPQWRNNTEWSLPHELGHQLGLTDLYALDYHGHENHRMPDNGDMLTHYYRGYKTMMHWHGPHLWSEVCAGYLNQTWNKPRGHFGDYYFAIPAENFLQIVDVNGLPVAGATVEIFQRGVVVDKTQPPQQQAGVTFYAVVEDGNFGHPVSSDPVMVGQNGRAGAAALAEPPRAGGAHAERLPSPPEPVRQHQCRGSARAAACARDQARPTLLLLAGNRRLSDCLPARAQGAVHHHAAHALRLARLAPCAAQPAGGAHRCASGTPALGRAYHYARPALQRPHRGVSGLQARLQRRAERPPVVPRDDSGA
jgi:hypothetical protein